MYEVIESFPLKYIWNIGGVDMSLYNPKTHELVEKKEAKIVRLKKELDGNLDTIKIIDEIVMDKSRLKSDLIIKNKQIEDELKELE